MPTERLMPDLSMPAVADTVRPPNQTLGALADSGAPSPPPHRRVPLRSASCALGQGPMLKRRGHQPVGVAGQQERPRLSETPIALPSGCASCAATCESN